MSSRYPVTNCCTSPVFEEKIIDLMNTVTYPDVAAFFLIVMIICYCLKHKCCLQRNKLQLPKLSQKSHVNWYLEQF